MKDSIGFISYIKFGVSQSRDIIPKMENQMPSEMETGVIEGSIEITVSPKLGYL